MKTPSQAVPGKRALIPELQIVRALAIIGVISVHASASATITMKESAYFYFYNFANIFMKFGTPTFILLSSFVLFYSYYNRPLTAGLIGSFYKKRLLYIIIPYIVFSVFYFVLRRNGAGLDIFTPDALALFWKQLRTGTAYWHLYFVFISIQFYLMFPILLWLTKKWLGLVHFLIPIGFAVQWGFILLLNNKIITVSNKGSWSLSYFSFYLAGAALGIYYPKIKSWFLLTRKNISLQRVGFILFVIACWLVLAFSHVRIYHNSRAYGTRYSTLLYEFLWNFHSMFSALVLIIAAHFIYRYFAPGITKLFYRFGQLSFGVYLIHMYFLYLYDKHMPSFGSSILNHLSYFGSWLFMIIASWLVVGLAARYLPYSWVLFGNLPKRTNMPLQEEGLDAAGTSHTANANGKKSSSKKIIIMIAVIVAVSAAAAGIWYKTTKDTTNSNKRQQLMAVESINTPGDQYDVIVAGTDPEGVAAAVSAARNGLKVLLVDGKNREILGGLMTVGGLNTLDLNYSPKKSAIPGQHIFLNKGIFQEWYDQVEGTSFDVNTAANAFYRMVKAEANIDLLMKVQSMKPITEKQADGSIIVQGMNIVTGDGKELNITAGSVIDATQDGDIAAAAGAPYTIGREDIGDPDAQMAVTLVFALKGVTQNIWDSFANHKNTGIDAMSAWGFPDAKDYVSSNPERVKMRGLNIGRQNDDTILINAMHIFKIDPLDPASIEEALEIGRAEAPRIVAYLKENFKELKDLDLAYTFDELYIRESRHIQGEYRLTMGDVLANRDHPDAIAYGSYNVDIQSSSHLDGGFILMSPEQYGVPFRSLVPLTIDGLLIVGRAASFDSLPHGSARVIPLGMATAQAAGVAAKIAADNNLSFRELSRSEQLVAQLRETLTKQGVDLTYNKFETPYYMNHKAYKGLVAAVSMLITSGDYDNKQFDLDGKSNMQRIVNNMSRVKKTHSDYFEGDPSVAIENVNEPAKQLLTLEQAVKTIAHTIDNAKASELTLDEMKKLGWIKEATIAGIANQQELTNGDFFMVLRDVVEYYAGVVYE